MARPPETPWLLAWSIVASQFAPPFLFSGVAVALPAMGRELGAGAVELGLVETAFLAGGLLGMLPAGRLADAMDKRALYKAGLLAFGAVTVAIGASSWMAGIVLLRLLQGLTSALFAATSMAILADLVPVGRRGRMFGASMGAIYTGLTLGPIAAGLLVEAWSWRAVFWVGAAGIFAAWALVTSRLPSRWRSPGRALHLPSTALLALAVLPAVAGSAMLQSGWPGLVLMAAGLCCAVWFVRVQLRTDRPLLDLRALGRNAPLRTALIVQGVIYCNAYCSIFVVSLFVQVPLGQPAPTAGQVIALGTVVMAVVAPLSGLIADRTRPRVVTASGTAVVLLSAVLGATLDAGASLPRVALVLIAQGVGFGLFSSPNMAIIMNSMAREQSGMASAMAAMARSIGMVTGMVLSAAMISLDYGSAPVQQDPERFVGTATAIYTALVGTALLALLAGVVGGRAGTGSSTVSRRPGNRTAARPAPDRTRW